MEVNFFPVPSCRNVATPNIKFSQISLIPPPPAASTYLFSVVWYSRQCICTNALLMSQLPGSWCFTEDWPQNELHQVQAVLP